MYCVVWTPPPHLLACLCVVIGQVQSLPERLVLHLELPQPHPFLTPFLRKEFYIAQASLKFLNLRNPPVSV